MGPPLALVAGDKVSIEFANISHGLLISQIAEVIFS
jgi:hypothetical protein